MFNKVKSLIKLIIALLTGCSYTSKPSIIIEPSLDTTLLTKVMLYERLIKNHQDKHGFIMTDKCDSLLFSGLLSAVNKKVNILAAKDEKGAWFRRPNKDCGPKEGNSRSTISRDMMLGVFYYIWYNKELTVATILMEQLKADLYMLKGDGTIGELLMLPSYMNTLALIIKGLGGPEYKLELAFPAIFGKKGGYVAHLTVWHILLRGAIKGEINPLEKDILAYHKEREPKNPLFNAAYHKYLDGDMTSVVQSLIDPSHWPLDRLPTTKEHCSDWPVQRDYSIEDWGPCFPVREHTGAELIIIYRLLLAKD